MTHGLGRWNLGVAIALVALSGGRGARAGEGPPRNGFWLEGRVGVGTVVVGTATAPVMQPGLVVGGRLGGRVNLGLGFSFFRLASVNTATTTVTVQPHAEIDLVKAHDERVMLYLKGALPLGAVVPSAGRNLFVVGYDLGLGVRYAPHPMFAVGIEGGLLGVFSDPGTNSIGAGIQTVYGALTGSFFYGK